MEQDVGEEAELRLLSSCRDIHASAYGAPQDRAPAASSAQAAAPRPPQAARPARATAAVPSADYGPHITLSVDHSRLLAARVPEFEGLPRLGVQDQRGMRDRVAFGQLGQEQRRALEARKAELDYHLTYFQLLVAADLLGAQYAAMDRSRLAVYRAQNEMVFSDLQSWTPQAHLLQLAQYALTDEPFNEYFGCVRAVECTILNSAQVQFAGGSSASAPQRDAAFERFMSRDFDAL